MLAEAEAGEERRKSVISSYQVSIKIQFYVFKVAGRDDFFLLSNNDCHFIVS